MFRVLGLACLILLPLHVFKAPKLCPHPILQWKVPKSQITTAHPKTNKEPRQVQKRSKLMLMLELYYVGFMLVGAGLEAGTGTLNPRYLVGNGSPVIQGFRVKRFLYNPEVGPCNPSPYFPTGHPKPLSLFNV